MAPPGAPEPWAAEQQRLAKLRVDRDEIDWAVYGQFVCGLDRVAGVDVSFFPDTTHAVAAVVVISFSSFEVLYARCAAIRLAVPYIAGYLGFREVPALAALLSDVPKELKPQVVLVDGNGAFHPRRCGAATHLGIITDLPTIGVAKTVLRVDTVNKRKSAIIARGLQRASDRAPLGGEAGMDEAATEPLAMLLRPSKDKGTIVVSSGHRVSLATAVAVTAVLCRTGRVPEPIRQADLQSRAAVREWFAGRDLGKLTVQKDLVPVIPKLKRPASPKLEREVRASARCTKTRWRVKGGAEQAEGAGAAGAVPAPDGDAVDGREDRTADAGKAEAKTPACSPKEPPAPRRHGHGGKLAGHGMVWRVKEAKCQHQDQERDLNQDQEAVGYFTACLRWMGGLCLCRG